MVVWFTIETSRQLIVRGKAMHRVHVIVSEPGNDQDQPVGISQVNFVFVQDMGCGRLLFCVVPREGPDLECM
jgi:hypothetical protein